MALMEMDQSLLNRAVNTGFSGGEKKRNEIFQMAVLEPRWPFWTKPIPAWISTR
jgi:Fe-S cluster assembly ATP-binding protein